MAHANAALTPKHRLRLARLVVDDGWPPSRAAEFFNVSWRTADKWAQRYRQEGPAGMNDRCSARHTQHAKTPQPVVRKVVHLRWKQRLGPVQIGAKLGMPPSTVHAVLVRCRLNRLTHIDRVSGEPARRYERSRPGELIHVDVTKFGNIPDGGGWRFHGRNSAQARRVGAARDQAARRGDPSSRGYAFIHHAVDDHSRLAYSEIHADERKETAVAFINRARAFFAAQIEAAKLIQRADFRRWEADPPLPDAPAPDLATDLRPRIDGLNRDLLAALSRAVPRLRRDKGAGARILIRADTLLSGDGIDAAARVAAIRPLIITAAE